MSDYTIKLFDIVNTNEDWYKYKEMKSTDYTYFGSTLNHSEMSLGLCTEIYNVKSELNDDRLQQANLDLKKKKYASNPFEDELSVENKDVKGIRDSFSHKYPAMKFVSRAAYKLWEIIKENNNLISKKGSTLHIAEAPGSFAQCTALYMDTYHKGKDDSIQYIVSISENIGGIAMDNTILKDKRYKVISNMEKDISQKFNGDLTNPSDMKEINKYIKEKFHFITADGGKDVQNKNFQEQEQYSLIFSEILLAITHQEKGGAFVLKLFDTLTNLTVKFIGILSSLYKKVYIHKPFMSRASNSEKYIVCEGFNGIEKNQIEWLIRLHTEVHENEEKKYYWNDLIPDWNLDVKYMALFRTINKKILIDQYNAIAEKKDLLIKKLVTKKMMDDQIRATKFWVKKYL